jgi:hypothetical protein
MMQRATILLAITVDVPDRVPGTEIGNLIALRINDGHFATEFHNRTAGEFIAIRQIARIQSEDDAPAEIFNR